MKSYLTATRLASKLQMLRSGKKTKTFVVVEGITDFRLYSKLIDRSVCEVVIGDSKQNVIEAVKTCEVQQLPGIIGIVDADFLHMEHSAQLPDSLFMTDGHDLEAMLINSKAYDNVLLEYADENKLARFEQRRRKTLKQILLENVALIGYLRRLSILYHLDLSFNELGFSEFTHISDLVIQEDRLINYLLFRSKKHHAKSSAEVTKMLNALIRPDDDLWQVCCGHDLMEFLTIGLVHLFGNYNAKKMISGQLEGCFRLTYQENYFTETKLYHALKSWEKEQDVYRIFKQ